MAVAVCIFDEGATRQSNGCRQTTTTETQILEDSRGSGLDLEHRLSGVPRVCELGVFSCVVGCIRRESVCYGGWIYLSSCTVSFSVKDQ